MLNSQRIRGSLMVVALLTGSQTALATAIPIVNAGFESPIIAPGQLVYPATGWTFDPQPGGVNSPPTPFLYQSVVAASFGPAPEGNNVGMTFGTPFGGNPRDVLEQQLASVLEPDTTYTLEVDVGRVTIVDLDTFGLLDGLASTVTLFAGNSVLAQDDSFLPLAPGTYGLSTVTYTALAGDPLIGQNLRIQLTGAGFAAFDNVRLTAIAVPEPGAMVLALIAAAGLVVTALRKRRGAA